jgi:hypothetical protein
MSSDIENTPEDHPYRTCWNPKRREYVYAPGAQDRRPIHNADGLPRDTGSTGATATPLRSGINVDALPRAMSRGRTIR